MEFFYLPLLFIGGIFTGLFASTVGSGALVSFPLLLLTGLPIHTAIGTKSFSAIFLELASGAKFHQKKKINLKLALIFGLLASIGAYFGANLVVDVNETYLNMITAVLLVLVFVILMFKNKLGLKKKALSHKHWIGAGILVFLLGIYGGFFGAGFGTFITFIFLLIGLDFIKSAAIARVVGLLVSATSATVFGLSGMVHYSYGFCLGIGMVIGGWFGADMGIKKGNRFIRGLFIVILVASVVQLVLNVLK